MAWWDNYFQNPFSSGPFAAGLGNLFGQATPSQAPPPPFSFPGNYGDQMAPQNTQRAPSFSLPQAGMTAPPFAGNMGMQPFPSVRGAYNMPDFSRDQYYNEGDPRNRRVGQEYQWPYAPPVALPPPTTPPVASQPSQPPAADSGAPRFSAAPATGSAPVARADQSPSSQTATAGGRLERGPFDDPRGQVYDALDTLSRTLGQNYGPSSFSPLIRSMLENASDIVNSFATRQAVGGGIGALTDPVARAAALAEYLRRGFQEHTGIYGGGSDLLRQLRGVATQGSDIGNLFSQQLGTGETAGNFLKSLAYGGMPESVGSAFERGFEPIAQEVARRTRADQPVTYLDLLLGAPETLGPNLRRPYGF